MATASTKPARVVQTPGETTAPTANQNDAPELPRDAADAVIEGEAVSLKSEAAPAVGGGTVTVSAEQFEQLMSLVKQQGAELAALKRDKAEPSSAPAADLPSVAEVQKAAPTVPVMTREGWFVPESGPLNPKRAQL